MSWQAREAMVHIGRAFGLTISSQIDLPELRPGRAFAAPDVFIRVGRGPQLSETALPLGLRVRAGPREFSMDAPRCAHISVLDGRDIWVDPYPGVDDRQLRIYLLGSAVGALLHQRGRLPLHASSLVAGGGVVAFAGRSGAGKSTLANALLARGWPLAGDDICALDVADEGAVTVGVGLNRIKLVDPSAAGDKRHLPALSLADDTDLPLKAIYLLPEPGEGADVFRQVRGAEAVKAVMDHTFRGHLVAPMHRTPAHLQQCVQIVRRVPVVRLARTWGPGGAAATADLLLLDIAARGRPAVQFDF
jgi:hypothetical protein